MVRPFRTRLPFCTVLFAGVCAARAPAQDSLLFSLSTSTQTSFGTLEDEEIACYDPATLQVRPWLRAATGAFYSSDFDGNGEMDEWNDVDALFVSTDQQGSVDEVLVSLTSTIGPFLDGDIVRLTRFGTMETCLSEAEVITAFGLSDGDCDVDAFHRADDGTFWFSFDDDEPSSILSTDASNVITDGSIVWFDKTAPAVGVLRTEGEIDQLVSSALGRSTRTGDTLGIAADSNGVLCFSVQSPTSDDATVFAADGGGRIVSREAALGLPSTAEIDALDLEVAVPDHLASHALPRAVDSTQALVVETFGTPAVHNYVLLLALVRGDSLRFPGLGFRGLALSADDPLFHLSLGAVPWLFGSTDPAGHGAITFPPAPPGVVITLFGQPYDVDLDAFGTPLAIELQG